MVPEPSETSRKPSEHKKRATGKKPATAANSAAGSGAATLITLPTTSTAAPTSGFTFTKAVGTVFPVTPRNTTKPTDEDTDNEDDIPMNELLNKNLELTLPSRDTPTPELAESALITKAEKQALWKAEKKAKKKAKNATRGEVAMPDKGKGKEEAKATPRTAEDFTEEDCFIALSINFEGLTIGGPPKSVWTFLTINNMPSTYKHYFNDQNDLWKGRTHEKVMELVQQYPILAFTIVGRPKGRCTANHTHGASLTKHLTAHFEFPAMKWMGMPFGVWGLMAFEKKVTDEMWEKIRPYKMAINSKTGGGLILRRPELASSKGWYTLNFGLDSAPKHREKLVESIGKEKFITDRKLIVKGYSPCEGTSTRAILRVSQSDGTEFDPWGLDKSGVDMMVKQKACKVHNCTRCEMCQTYGHTHKDCPFLGWHYKELRLDWNTATSPEKLVKAKPKGEAEDEDSEEEAPSNEEPKGDVEEVTGEQSATMETDSEQPTTRHTPNSQNHNRMNPYNLDPPCQSSPKSEIVMCLYAMQ
jgi:hypothetical protein